MRSISKFIQALVVLIFGIIWLCVVSTTGAPWFFSLFGVIFILIAAYIVIKAFVNRCPDLWSKYRDRYLKYAHSLVRTIDMKVLLVNGSPHENGCTYTSLREVADTLEENGISTEIHWIGKGEIIGCKACGYCKKNGRCVTDDDVNAISARVDEFDGFVFGAPVYYSGPAGQICTWMDRFFYVNSAKLAGKVGATVVNARRGGNSASFERLNQYYLISSMVVPGSQYWNITHGSTPDDVKKDKEGLQTMRALGRNIAWILKCIDLGKKAGLQVPDREPKIFTNFIMPKE